MEESVGGIWPRSNVPQPVATEPQQAPLPIMPMQDVIDQMKDSRESEEGIPNPDFVEEFPVTWPGWADKTDDGMTRRAIWNAFRNNIGIIDDKGTPDDVEDEWLSIEPDAALDHLADVHKAVKVRMREVIARGIPNTRPGFAGINP